MADLTTGFRRLRRRCGDGYTFVRDKVLGVTRFGIYEAACVCGPTVVPLMPVRFRSGGPGDLLAFTQEEHEYGDSEKQFGLERLRRGDSVMIGESGDAVVFYAWQMYGQIDLDMDVRVPMRSGMAYSYKVFTVPRARNARICGAYYGHLKALLREEGYGRLICRIAAGNSASIKAHLRAGFERRGTLWNVVTPAGNYYYADRDARAWLPSAVPPDYFGRSGFLTKCETS